MKHIIEKYLDLISGAIAIVCCAACIVFAILKLSGIIAWSWVWVFSPIWGTLALMLLISLVFYLVDLFAGAIMMFLEQFF